jgi:anaphase-promoting complex subunit 8
MILWVRPRKRVLLLFANGLLIVDYNESLIMFEELRRTHPSRLEEMDVFSNLLYLQDSKDKLCVLALECDKVDKYRPETCCVRGRAD